MLKMHFRKGSIIRFGFNCQVKGVPNEGKVIYVGKEEIILVPQIMIQLPNSMKLYTDIPLKKEIDTTRSIDSDREVRIDRNIIASWEYARIETGRLYTDVVRENELCNVHTRINCYGNGIYESAGDYFE